MKRMKKTVASILTAVVALSAVGFAGCNEENLKNTLDDVKTSVGDLLNGSEESNAESNTENKPSANEYQGTIVKDGESYEMLSAMAFTATQTTATETETFTPVSVDLKATVEPADANQNVVWSVEFVNSASEWANGKNINEYMQVTQSSSGISTGTVTCLKPFGEQIKITAMSEENADISASCVVDFIQTIEFQSLVYGNDLPINFGGITNVSWDVSSNGIGFGGEQNLSYKYGQSYTIANEVSAVVDLVSPAYYHKGHDVLGWGDTFDEMDKSENEYKDDYFKLYSAKWEDMMTFDDGIRDCGVKSFSNIKNLSFNLAFLRSTFLTAVKNNNFDYLYQYSSGIYGIYEIEEGSLYTLRLTMTESATGLVTEKVSLINVTQFTNNAQVQSISLEKENLSF